MAHPKTVLIVDDSRFARLMVRGMIAEAFPDWTVIEAENAAVALAEIAVKTVDIFLVDHNMPGMTGLDLIVEINQRVPGARVALLTANIQNDIRSRAEALGADFLSKPPTKERIVRYLADAEPAV